MDQSPPPLGWLFEIVGPIIWVVLCYLIFIVPTVVIRLAFLRGNALVP